MFPSYDNYTFPRELIVFLMIKNTDTEKTQSICQCSREKVSKLIESKYLLRKK